MSRGGWILKSEPVEYSISNLAEQIIGRWDGVRNYQARNFLGEMKLGEKLFFYHSNCSDPGIYGAMTVHKTGYPDPTAVDRHSKYYDSKNAPNKKNPWVSIDVKIAARYDVPLLLTEIRDLPLGDCRLTAKGNRLSVVPLTAEQYQILDQELLKRNPQINSTISSASATNQEENDKEAGFDMTRQETKVVSGSESPGTTKPLKVSSKKRAKGVDEQTPIPVNEESDSKRRRRTKNSK